MLKGYLKNSVFIILCVLVVTGLPRPAYALKTMELMFEGLKDDLDEGSVIGLGALWFESPYEGVTNDVYPVPMLSLESKQFFADGPVFGYYFNDREKKLRPALIGSPRFQGYEDDDSSVLNGMDDREWAFDGGLRLDWENRFFSLKFEGVSDLTGEHEGQEARLTLSQGFFRGLLTPRAGVRWKSESLVDRYFGVRPNEARAGRPEYEPDSDMEYMAGLTIGVPLGEKWAIVGDIQCIFLGEEVKDSPIVDEDFLMGYVLGLGYRF